MKTPSFLAAQSLLALALFLPARAALVSHYTFDESTGVTAADSGPAGADGVIGSNVTLATPGVFGTSFTFNNDASQNGIVDMGNATDLFSAITTSQSITVSVWMSWTTSGTRDSAIFLGDNTASNRYLDVGTVAGTTGVYGRIRDGVNSGFADLTPTPTLALNDGGWHHIAYTADAVNEVTRLYVDGQLVSESTATPAVTFPSVFNNFEVGRLGRSSPTDAFAGSVDELRIYDSILTESEIAALAVPEPATPLALGLLGTLGLALRRRR